MKKASAEISASVDEDSSSELLIPNLTRLLASIQSDAISKKDINARLLEFNIMLGRIARDPNDYDGKDEYFKNVRIIVFALSRYSSTKLDRQSLSFIDQIQNNIGQLPGLNPNVTQTITDRGYSLNLRENEVWHDREDIKKRVKFYKHDKHAIVRTLLLQEEVERNRDFSSSSEQYYISHANVQYYDVPADLHADHLQPSAQLIDRQLEIIEAMNLFPDFASDMKRQNPNYFQKSNGKWYGTRRFFLDYHNCLDNLWLMNGGHNVGKQSSDPIDYLQNHSLFGSKFFDHLKRRGERISKEGIIYTVNGVPLAKIAKEWLVQTYPLTRELTYSHKQVEARLRTAAIAIDELSLKNSEAARKSQITPSKNIKYNTRKQVDLRQEEEHMMQASDGLTPIRSKKAVRHGARDLKISSAVVKSIVGNTADKIEQRITGGTGHTDSHSDTDSSSSKSNQGSKQAVIDRFASEEVSGIMGRIKSRMKALKKSGPTESEIKKDSVPHTGGSNDTFNL
ncbi:MAG: hypothetical protein CK423_05105 [Legionella sp.]|nr:MAG: hypothetical protein CK423_05105 [Legionella sp.]